MNTNKNKKAFTLIELIFAIVIMGILGKFGVEFLAQAYKNFIHSKINNELQSNSSTAVEYISTKLQYRIKPSMIAREDDGTFTSLKDYSAETSNIIEWVGYDIEGLRGTTTPLWSGVFDLNPSTVNKLVSLQTNTTSVDTLIQTLSDTSTIKDSAIYFVGSSFLKNNWGWDGNKTKFDTQLGVPTNQNAIHPIQDNTASPTDFFPIDSDGTDNDFANVEAFEYYQLAWTAYAVGFKPDTYNTTTNTGTLMLWYDYQPWKGEKYDDTNTKSSIIMNDVSSFQFISTAGIIKIQVCTKSLLLKDSGEDYSICKEKTVF